jgi:hypothetical protein
MGGIGATMMLRDTVEVIARDWYQFKAPFHIYLVCCDCGLVHKVEGKIVNGEIAISFSREDRMTAEERKCND